MSTRIDILYGWLEPMDQRAGRLFQPDACAFYGSTRFVHEVAGVAVLGIRLIVTDDEYIPALEEIPPPPGDDMAALRTWLTDHDITVTGEPRHWLLVKDGGP